MQVLVTGAKGQLGIDVLNELGKRGHEFVAVDIEEMDITSLPAVEQVMKDAKADAVIHCAAYTAVDAAEGNKDLCRMVNAAGTENIAKACRSLNMKMIYLSTDYVFHGDGETPFCPEDDRKPLNFYGQTKYEGELAVQKYLDKYYIVRISWVFGLHGKNFVKTMLKLGRERGTVSVVEDQVGSPTYTVDLARLLVDMIETDKHGVYHATNEGFCSWYEFAKEIFKQAGMNVAVTPVLSGAFPVKARRPKNSRMSKDKLSEQGFERLPEWKDALSRYLYELNQSDKTMF